MDRKNRLKARLMEAGSSQRSIADELGVSQTAVSRILSGSYPQKTVKSQRLVRALVELVSAKTGISIEELRELTAAEQAA